jgi:hypothetical protein
MVNSLLPSLSAIQSCVLYNSRVTHAYGLSSVVQASTCVVVYGSPVPKDSDLL